MVGHRRSPTCVLVCSYLQGTLDGFLPQETNDPVRGGSRTASSSPHAPAPIPSSHASDLVSDRVGAWMMPEAPDYSTEPGIVVCRARYAAASARRAASRS